jgi:hypothetical protein
VTTRQFHFLCLLVFLLTLGLRGAFARYNRYANDDHMLVVRYILANDSLPTKSDCQECFHPKLYHYTVAKVIQGIGWASANNYRQNLVAQFLSFLAGIITVAIVWRFISGLPGEDRTLKLLSFSLVALNPVLIGISSQATNDAFAILFSTSALYFAYVYLAHQKTYAILLSLLFVLLGIASKSNAWVTALAIFLCLLVYACLKKGQSVRFLMVAFGYLMAGMILSYFNPLTQYAANLREYRSPILTNIDSAPPLTWSAAPAVERPSIFSVQDSLLTFRFIELLKHPRVEYGDQDCPDFCTSLWTVLYGRANSLHLDNWPPSWSTSGEEGFPLTRAIFILAIFPTLLFLSGGVIEVGSAMKAVLWRERSSAQAMSYGLFAITAVGFAAFIILYALIYRNYSVMKAIFVFPALLVFPVFFLRAAEKLERFLSKRSRWLPRLLNAGLVLLLALYVLDAATMILNIYVKVYRS